MLPRAADVATLGIVPISIVAVGIEIVVIVAWPMVGVAMPRTGPLGMGGRIVR